MPGPDAFAPMRVDRVLGRRYRLIRPIAKGGMAEVWEGYDDILSRPVAVKILLSHLASDRNLVERFRREAIAAARLSHPGVVATYDTGTDDGTAWIVMELVRGHTLRQLLTERGPMDPPMAVDVAGQIADALAHAHRAGLVHRDIKPANVLLVEEDTGPPRAKVTDFGIAKATEGIGLDLTRTGMVLGTPKYLSPEQVEGQEPDARADLYSLGVVLFEMLTARVPFEGPTDMATAVAHVRQLPPRVSSIRPDVPMELDQLVADLLAKDPAKRIPTALALRQALARVPLRPAGPAGPSGLPGPSSSGGRGPYVVSPPPPPPPSAGRVLAPRPVVGAGRVDPVVAAPGGAPRGVGTPVPGGLPGAGPGGVPGPGDRFGVAPTNALNGGVGRGGPLGGAERVAAGTTVAGGLLGGGGVPGGNGFSGGSGFAGSGVPGNGSGPLGVPGAPGPDSLTRYQAPAGSATGLLVPEAPPASVGPTRRRRRRRWLPGLGVGALVVAGVLVAYALLSGNMADAPQIAQSSTGTTLPGAGSGSQAGVGPGAGAGAAANSAPISVAGVQVWMNVTGHSEDNPNEAKNTVDGNPNTFWSTDHYNSEMFGGLYSGEGLAIHVNGSHTLHTLAVTTHSLGWSGETYVSNTLPAFGSPVTSWGAPTQSRSGISGSTTFDLQGKSGSWVLFWLTNLGPDLAVQVDEFQVR